MCISSAFSPMLLPLAYVLIYFCVFLYKSLSPKFTWNLHIFLRNFATENMITARMANLYTTYS